MKSLTLLEHTIHIKNPLLTGNKGQKGRIDLCLANYNCLSQITEIRHIPIGMISSRGQKPARLITDHSLVQVSISLNEVDKGPGSFRANPLIETNAEYASLVRINITALLAEISGVSSTQKMQAKFNTLRRETLLKKDKNLMTDDERLQLAILDWELINKS